MHPLWYARKQSALDNTEDRSEFYPKCKVKCRNESNVLQRKRKAVVSDLKKKCDFYVCELVSCLKVYIDFVESSSNKNVIGKRSFLISF